MKKLRNPKKTRTPSLNRNVLSRRLLNWYDRHRRDLPWRRRADDPYAQLLAEFMLQQTQVSTVLGYYERFVERFPTVHALASASLDDVLTLWSGLGYYGRARNLHAAAKQIVDEYDGTVPRTVDELMSLPGVGRYTAGAIASIAYGVRAPVLDGNVIRVLMRLSVHPKTLNSHRRDAGATRVSGRTLMAMEADPKSPAVRTRLWDQAENLLPLKRCGDFNQAMMELGATLCSPRTPKCDACPLKPHCRAYQENLTDRIPRPAKRTRVLPTRMVVAAIRRKQELLFVQRPTSGLWGGLWELPSEQVIEGESLDLTRRRLEENLPIRCRLSRSPVGAVTRQLTHRRITFNVFTSTVRHQSQRPSGGLSPPYPRPWRWVKPDGLPALGISRACRAILDLLGWSGSHPRTE